LSYYEYLRHVQLIALRNITEKTFRNHNHDQYRRLIVFCTDQLQHIIPVVIKRRKWT